LLRKDQGFLIHANEFFENVAQEQLAIGLFHESLRGVFEAVLLRKRAEENLIRAPIDARQRVCILEKI
jgi:hypothetical protein